MNVQHINLKFFIENPEEINPGEFSGIFNNWIQRQVMDELLIDVADYLHVHNGPAVILIGHEADYSLDNRSGRLGLLYNRKAPLDGSVQEKLTRATYAVLTAARLLEKENSLKFSGRELQMLINDRELAPNTLETFSTLETGLRAFFDRLYKGTEYRLTYQSSDPRECFKVVIKAAVPFTIETLLFRVDALLKDLPVETTYA